MKKEGNNRGDKTGILLFILESSGKLIQLFQWLLLRHAQPV